MRLPSAFANTMLRQKADQALTTHVGMELMNASKVPSRSLTRHLAAVKTSLARICVRIRFWYNSKPHSTIRQSSRLLPFDREPHLRNNRFVLGQDSRRGRLYHRWDYLARHLRWLGEIQQAGERVKRVAYQQEMTIPRGATLRKAGDIVLAKRHLPCRVKIQGVWCEKVVVVASTPPEQGGFIVDLFCMVIINLLSLYVYVLVT
ncbi:hypothetical protein PoB_007317200 [Plakobranchus ocellatus]|uniref:Integrase catalytic domain-containing protein n=1 Tax=Plakobranchus ocellatus TaxID=259542 RepID=A0AAV4DQS3_9GAST|nr:hypothetical protein PoB_007317200 [Plakobranchus ocellatus]